MNTCNITMYTGVAATFARIALIRRSMALDAIDKRTAFGDWMKYLSMMDHARQRILK